jgi:hypothetical protein
MDICVVRDAVRYDDIWMKLVKFPLVERDALGPIILPSTLGVVNSKPQLVLLSYELFMPGM